MAFCKCGGIVIVLLFLLEVLVMGHCREVLLDDESPSIKVGAMRIVDEEEIVEEGVPCHVEYQVMKRVVGTCIKLGRSSRGCVAGNYLHPLHPECIVFFETPMEEERQEVSLRDVIFPIDDYFLSIALLAGLRSKDPCTQVGACVVNRQNVLLGTGYNGMPRGCDDDLTPWSKTSDNPLKNKFYFVCHAELNAIANAKRNLEDCKIYVTLFPCNECAKMIIQHGITEVVYLSDKNKHKNITVAAKMMLDRAGVKYRQLRSNKKITIEFPNVNTENDGVEQLTQAVDELGV